MPNLGFLPISTTRGNMQVESREFSAAWFLRWPFSAHGIRDYYRCFKKHLCTETPLCCNGHSPTDTSVRSGAQIQITIIMLYATAVAAGQSQRFYSGGGILNWFNWHYLSCPPQIPRRWGFWITCYQSNSFRPFLGHQLREVKNEETVK
jgi:hypothetical protein